MDPVDADAVDKLNIFAQKSHSKLIFEDIASDGPAHDKTFMVRAVLGGKAYGEGKGKKKKEARQNAAKETLRLLEMEQQDQQQNLDSENAPENPTVAVNDYVSILYDYCYEKNVPIRAEESINLESNTEFRRCCSFVIDDRKYPTAYAMTKKEAKEEAARIAYQSLNVKSKNQKGKGTNFVGMVTHYCQKTDRILNFILEKTSGPTHCRQFFFKVMINDKVYPTGEGRNSKEAKQKAAELAWAALQEQSDWDSKVSTYRSTMSEDSISSMMFPQTSMLNVRKSPSNIIRSTSDVIASNPVQVPLRPTLSAPTGVSTPSSLESIETSSQSIGTGTSDSVVFTDSSNPSKEKDSVQNNNAENRQSETSGKFTSDFDSIESLAKGGFGRVYRAREKLVDKHYAVKIVRCKTKALREVGALSELLHDNIIRYYNCWLEDTEYQCSADITADSSSTTQSTSISSAQYLYIKMELCDRKTLKDWIHERNNDSVKNYRRREDSLPIVQQIVSGVHCIHSKNFIHRDLKPPNIMFGQNGEVKIGDFGLVTAGNDDDDANEENEKNRERTGRTGTDSYMAPEQRSKNTYDHKVDIFALGLIYFELLWNLSTGHERGVMLTNARSQKLPEEFSQKFPQENQIIMSMLCDGPDDRPEASTLKAELEKWALTFNAENNMHKENVTA